METPSLPHSARCCPAEHPVCSPGTWASHVGTPSPKRARGCQGHACPDGAGVVGDAPRGGLWARPPCPGCAEPRTGLPGTGGTCAIHRQCLHPELGDNTVRTGSAPPELRHPCRQQPKATLSCPAGRGRGRGAPCLCLTVLTVVTQHEPRSLGPAVVGVPPSSPLAGTPPPRVNSLSAGEKTPGGDGARAPGPHPTAVGGSQGPVLTVVM